MSNKKQTPFEEFNWPEFQKKYMEAMMAFNTSPNMFGSMPASAPTFGNLNPFAQAAPKPAFDSFWVNAMNDWWKSVKPEKEQEYENMFEKVLEQCRNYYFMSEQFSKLIEGMTATKNKNEDIIAFINKQFKGMESSFTTTQHNFNWTNFVDSFEQPFELLKNVFSNESHSSDEMFGGVSPNAKRMREQLLSIPGLGYSREMQDKLQEVLKLWANYQDNNQEYQAVMARLNHQALEIMRKKIVAMTKKGEEIKSMRQVYDLWIECNEKVYGEYVFTEEYTELNGRLVNSLMAFKQKNHEITEDALTAMNMPTSKAVDELERRQYMLRKQVNAMQAEINTLQKELQKKEKATTAPAPAKEAKPVAKAKKKTKKRASKPNSSKVVQFKQTEKKAQKNVKTTRKKAKAKSTSADAGTIELKF